jgi:predicted enzyme related to lactoylglutathione lyase
MSERDGYIHGVPCWIDTTQPDPERACDFYRSLFGWDFVNAGRPDNPYYIGCIRGGSVAAVSPQQAGSPPFALWNTYIWVDDAEVSASVARMAGGNVLHAPMDIPGAGRMAVIADPEGAIFCLWQAQGNKGAKVVNEHGALNFNGLATRDVDKAAAFYGAVFGWKVLDIAGGKMWALPGYGDHLASFTPGIREGMDSMGAPAGFIDVVAMINPISDGDTQTPPNWSVTFAVDDAVAITAKARELGAEVLAEPFDAPWTRLAVLRDPQGAVFITGQFVPENANLGS